MLRRSSISAVNQEIFDQQVSEEKVAKANAEMDDMLLNQNDIKLEEKKNFEDNAPDFNMLLDQRDSDQKLKNKVQRPRASNAAQMSDNVDSFIEQQMS